MTVTGASTRLQTVFFDFAKALSGNDPEKADLLLDAFKKGFKEATKSWGQDLPDISQRTYDAVVEVQQVEERNR